MIRKIKSLPKDIQRFIVSYIIPTQNFELLIDIRNFNESLNRLKYAFLEIAYERLDIDIINYSEEEIQSVVNHNIFHNILIELMYTIPDNQYFFCNFIPLVMVSREWILKYQKNTVNMLIENNIPNIENKIRFIFGIMTPENRNKLVDYYYREDIEEEEEDYDW